VTRSPDYFLTKPVRSACWVLAALLFYAMFTRELLSKIALNDEEERTFFCAWIALGRWIWNEPGKIANVGYETFGEAVIFAIIHAVIGSLPMLFLAIGRKGWLLGPILLLSIPFAWISAVFIHFGIGLVLDDLPPGLIAIIPTLSYLSYFATAHLEFLIGFVLPLIGYPFLFGGVVLYLVYWLIFHRKPRQAQREPDAAGS
jgi:hypothetical protein